MGHDASSHTSPTRAAHARFSVPLVQRIPVAPQIATVASITQRLSPFTKLFSSWSIPRVRPFPVMPHQGAPSGGLQASGLGGPLQASCWGHALMGSRTTLVSSEASSALRRNTGLRTPGRCPAAPYRRHDGGERASSLS